MARWRLWRSGPGSDPLGLGAVCVYLPQRLSRHATGLLAALAGAGPLVVVAGVTGDERADAEVIASVTRLAQRCGADTETTATIAPSAQAGATEADGPAPSPVALPAVDPERTRVVSCSDADEEVRVAVRAVIDAARAGTPLDRIAILYAEAEPYAASSES